MKTKKPIADLPPGIGVYKTRNGTGEEFWRVRIGRRFTEGAIYQRDFRDLPGAREWIDSMTGQQAQIMAAELSPSQLADCKSALLLLGGKTGLVDVVRFYLKHHRPKELTKSLDEAKKDFLLSKEKAGRRPRSVKAYRNTLDAFSGDHPRHTVAGITREDVEDWLDDDAWQAPTRRHHLVNLAVFFGWSKTRGWLDELPTKGVERPTLEDKPPGILMVDQLEKLLEKAQEEENNAQLVPSIVIQAFAGLRTSEIRKLEWSEINLEQKTIEVTAAKAKTRQRRIVDVLDNLRAWLLPHVRREGLVAPASYRKDLATLKVAATILSWPNNALRHSFGSYHLAHFRDSGKTAFQMGHRDSNMLFAHYRELVKPQDALEYWNIFPKRIKNKAALKAA